MVKFKKWELNDDSDKSYARIVDDMLCNAEKWMDHRSFKYKEIDDVIRVAIRTTRCVAYIYTPTIYSFGDYCGLYIPTLFDDKLYMVVVAANDCDPTNIMFVKRMPILDWINNHIERGSLTNKMLLMCQEHLELEALKKAQEELSKHRVMMAGSVETACQAENALLEAINHWQSGNARQQGCRAITIPIPYTHVGHISTDRPTHLYIEYFVHPDTSEVVLSCVSVRMYDNNTMSWKHNNSSVGDSCAGDSCAGNPYEDIKTISARLDTERQDAYESIEREVIRSAIDYIRGLEDVTCGDADTAKKAEVALVNALDNYRAVSSSINHSERKIFVYIPGSSSSKFRVAISFQYRDDDVHIYSAHVEAWDTTNACWRIYGGPEEDLCSEYTVSTMIDSGKPKQNSAVDHPGHYGGADNPYEAIKVIEAWMDPSKSYGFCVGNALKYICRAGKKDGSSTKQDLEKAIWYLKRACEEVKANEEEAADKK